MDGAIQTDKTALRERRDTLVAALQRELPEARFIAAVGWLLHVGRAAAGRRCCRAGSRRQGARRPLFVKGTDFLLEGGGNTLRLAYSVEPPSRSTRGSRPAEAARSLGVAA